jgi:hypothetical protein
MSPSDCSVKDKAFTVVAHLFSQLPESEWFFVPLEKESQGSHRSLFLFASIPKEHLCQLLLTAEFLRIKGQTFEQTVDTGFLALQQYKELITRKSETTLFKYTLGGGARKTGKFICFPPYGKSYTKLTQKLYESDVVPHHRWAPPPFIQQYLQKVLDEFATGTTFDAIMTRLEYEGPAVVTGMEIRETETPTTAAETITTAAETITTAAETTGTSTST